MNNQFDVLTEALLKDMAYGLGNYTPITRQEFIDLIIDFDNSKIGAKPISFTSVTEPLYKKTGFPYQRLFKVGQTAGMIGTDYGANVNAQRGREDKAQDFKAQASKTIKEYLSHSVAVTHKDNIVLRYRPLNPQPSYFVVQTNVGQLQEVPSEDIIGYLYPVAPAVNQGLDKQIDHRTYGFDKMVSSSFQGKEYLISDIDPLRKSVFDIVRDKLKS